MSPTLQLAQALIARPSVTPSDADCLDLIAQRLQALGFINERMAGALQHLRHGLL